MFLGNLPFLYMSCVFIEHFFKIYKFFTMFINRIPYHIFRLLSPVKPFLLASWIRKDRVRDVCEQLTKIIYWKWTTFLNNYLSLFYLLTWKVWYELVISTQNWKNHTIVLKLYACLGFPLRLSYIDRHKEGENEIMFGLWLWKSIYCNRMAAKQEPPRKLIEN